MEQAVNTFQKGLNTDSHPMAQGNDSLTDALNATFVTMNGNEIILQNDMGNRRIDNAFLPSGYQPVGMKEYGGIIYVAAYNPITNKSQIGSFPSPQKKFSNVDGGGTLDLEKFLDISNIFEESFKLKNILPEVKLQFIKSDTQLIPLTEDSSIYPGDKFTVYCSNLYKQKDLLTNYENISIKYPDKIYSPKNKEYTLYLGVLNSQNEFMDITPNLVRWEEKNGKSQIINFRNYDYEVSEKYKFNKGYFIPKSFDNSKLEETISDANFIRARQALAINTYGSKLVGPLYLKAYYNHVDDFDFNITGFKQTVLVDYLDRENREGPIYREYAYLIIDGFFTYNCQDNAIRNSEGDLKYWSPTSGKFYTYNYDNMKYVDGEYEQIINPVSWGNIEYREVVDHQISDDIEISHDIYETYEDEKPVENYGFIFCPSLPYKRHSFTCGTPIYDDVYNNYKIKITQRLIFPLQDVTDRILNYVITVPANWESNKAPYLRGLTTQGSINLDLLNSGKSSLIGWRFYNDVEKRTTRLAYFFELYPIQGKSFSNLNIQFILGSSVVGTYRHPGEINGGLTSVEISWDDKSIFGETPLQKQNVYTIKLSYTNCEGQIETPETKLWLLTTELFNSCFNSSSNDYIENYCYRKSDREEAIFKAKTTIKLAISNLDQISIGGNVDYSSEGSLISTSEYIDYWSIQTDTLYVDYSKVEIEILNKDLYPDYIKLNPSSINIEYLSSNINDLANDKISLPSGWGNPSDYLSIVPINNTSSDNSQVQFAKIISKERVKDIGDPITEFQNIFFKVSEALQYILQYARENSKYCGIFPDYNYRGGFEDDVPYALVRRCDSEYGMEAISNPNFQINQLKEDSYCIGYKQTDDTTNFVFKRNGSDEPITGDYNNGFNSLMINNNSLCTWAFANYASQYKLRYVSSNSSCDASSNTILWWKALQSENLDGVITWRASSRIINNMLLNDTKSLAKALFGEDFYFCFVKQASGGNVMNLYRINRVTSNIFGFDSVGNLDVNINFKLVKGGTTNNYITNKNKFQQYLPFTESFDQNEILYTKTYTLKHNSYNIKDSIFNIASVIRGIDKYKGRSKDSQDNTLNINNIYVENSKGELEVVSDSPFIITGVNSNILTNCECYNLYCKADSNTGAIMLMNGEKGYQSRITMTKDNDDGDTVNIHFDKLPLIQKISKSNS